MLKDLSRKEFLLHIKMYITKKYFAIKATQLFRHFAFHDACMCTPQHPTVTSKWVS